MISLVENRVSLQNLAGTIEALDQIDKLIVYFSDGKIAPAYLTVRYVPGTPEIQVDRSAFLEILRSQREKLVQYFATLGIDANN
jgi:hypothetical protein